MTLPSWQRTADAVRSAYKRQADVVKRHPSTLLWPLLVAVCLVAASVTLPLSLGCNSNALAQQQARARAAAASAAAAIEADVAAAVSPVYVLSGLIRVQPLYQNVSQLFDQLAPELRLTQQGAPVRTALNALFLAPAGVVRRSWPPLPASSWAPDLITGSTPQGLQQLEAVRRHDALLLRQSDALSSAGPLMAGFAFSIPVFITGADPGDTFGAPDKPNAACGASDCAYDATTRSAFWGLCGGVIQPSALLANGPLSWLGAQGYRYRLESAHEAAAVIAGSAKPPQDAESVAVHLPGSTWVLYASPEDGWEEPSSAWCAGVISGLCVASIAIAVLLYTVLFSRRKHQSTLESLLPKDVIREMKADKQLDALKPPVFTAETPAQLLLQLLGQLLEGEMPDLHVILFLKSALMRSLDFYQPLNLRGHIKQANLDADVVNSLIRQLGGGGGLSTLLTQGSTLGPVSLASCSMRGGGGGSGLHSSVGGGLLGLDGRTGSVHRGRVSNGELVFEEVFELMEPSTHAGHHNHHNHHSPHFHMGVAGGAGAGASASAAGKVVVSGPCVLSPPATAAVADAGWVRHSRSMLRVATAGAAAAAAAAAAGTHSPAGLRGCSSLRRDPAAVRAHLSTGGADDGGRDSGGGHSSFDVRATPPQRRASIFDSIRGALAAVLASDLLLQPPSPTLHGRPSTSALPPLPLPPATSQLGLAAALQQPHQQQHQHEQQRHDHHPVSYKQQQQQAPTAIQKTPSGRSSSQQSSVSIMLGSKTPERERRAQETPRAHGQQQHQQGHDRRLRGLGQQGWQQGPAARGQQQQGEPLQQQRSQRHMVLRQLMPQGSSGGPLSGLHSHLLHYSSSMPPLLNRAATVADNGQDDDDDDEADTHTSPSDGDNVLMSAAAAAAATADDNILIPSMSRTCGALLLTSLDDNGHGNGQTGSAETEEPDATRYPTHLQPTFTTGSSTGNTVTTTTGTAPQLNTAFSSALAAAQAALHNTSLPVTMSGAVPTATGRGRPPLRSCATLDSTQMTTGTSPPAPAATPHHMSHHALPPPHATAATAGATAGAGAGMSAAADHAMARLARRPGSFLAPSALASGLTSQPHPVTENGAGGVGVGGGGAGAGGRDGGRGGGAQSLLMLRSGSSVMARYLVGDLSPPRHCSAGGVAPAPAPAASPGAAAVVPGAEESRLVRRRGTSSRLITPPSPAHHPSPAAPLLEDVERVLARADDWCFDTWALDEVSQGHALSALGFYLLQREGLIAGLGLKPFTVARLLRTIESGYQPNPYHSATHAADVLQTLHVIIHGAGLHVHYLDKLGLTAAYFAAAVHDHRHPGLTNDFLIATGDALALRYNDRSPLENHHVASVFELMTRPELNMLAPLPAADRAAFRKLVIELVLATDMKQHFAILSHFNTVHSLASYAAKPDAGQARAQQHTPEQGVAHGSGAGGDGGGTQPRRQPSKGHALATATSPGAGAQAVQAAGSAAAASLWGTAQAPGVAGPEAASAPRPHDEAERVLSLQVALKVADVGHLGEKLPVHQRWLAGLEEEFFRQGDKERQLGIPISPLFDRNKKGVSKGQAGFYDFVGNPLVYALASAFPGAKPLEAAFNDNYMYWRGVGA